MRALLAVLLVCALQGLALAAPPAPETTEDWYEWSEDFAHDLRKDGRRLDAVQEWRVCASLQPDALAPCVEGALDVIRAADEPGRELNGDLYSLAEAFLRAGVPRGGRGNSAFAYVIGRLRLVDKEWGVAWSMFSQAKRGGWSEPGLDAWLLRATVNRAALLVRGYRVGEAITSLTEVLDKYGKAPGITEDDLVALKINLAHAHRKQNERITSQEILDGIIKDGYANPLVYDLLGEVYADQGRMDEALEMFRKAMEMNRDPSYADPMLHAASALLKYQPPKPDEAEGALRRYLSVRKDDPDGLAVLGMVYHERGELKEAVRTFRRVVRAKPKNHEILTKLIAVLSEMGEDEEVQRVKQRLDDLRNSARRAANPEKEDLEKAERGERQ